MSDNKFKLGDDLIAVVRELVQLSLLTGTNIVDHLRSVQVEVDSESSKLVPTEDYIEAYDEMIGDLNKQAQTAQAAAELGPQPDADDAVVPEEAN